MLFVKYIVMLTNNTYVFFKMSNKISYYKV